MPEGVRGGRIVLPVVADLSKFREDLVTGLKAATKGVKAEVPVTFDVAQTRRALQRAVQAAQKQVKATIGVEVNAPRLRLDLERAVTRASRGVNATVGVKVDASGLATELRKKVETAERGVRAKVGIEWDTAGLKTRLRGVVERAERGVNAKIPVEWRTTGLKSRLITAVKAAQSGVSAVVGVRVDSRGLSRQLREAARDASKNIRASIGLDVGRRRDTDTRNLPAVPGQEDREYGDFDVDIGADSTRFRLHLTALREWAERPVIIPIWADPRPFATIVATLRSMAERPVTIPVAAANAGVGRGGGGSRGGGGGRGGGLGALDAGPLERYLYRLQQFFLVIGTFGGFAAVLEGLAVSVISLAGALSAVVAGLFAITSAAGPAIAALAVIPNLLAAAAQAGVALFASFSGLGNAISAIREQRTTLATAGADLARQEADNARRVEDARIRLADAEVDAAERIADARRRVSDVQRQGAQAIADARQRVLDTIRSTADRVVAAEQNIVSSQRNSLLAQERLNDAREEARERLQDLALELRRAALDEESAAIGLERAREQFNETAANPFATELDRREAELQYQEALQRVDEVAERNDDLAREGGELRQKGVEQADAVVAAKQDLVEAQRAELEAERELADARSEGARQVSEARREAAQAEADAQRNLADAQRDLSRAQRDSQRSLRDAQRNLADALRQAEEPAGAVATALDNVDKALEGLSPEARRFAYFIADEVIPALEGVRNEVSARLLPSIEDSLRRLLTGLLPTVAQELVRTADVLGEWFSRLTDFLTSPDFTNDFQIISAGNLRFLERFGDAVNNLLEALTDVAAVVAQPGGLLDRFGVWVETLTAGWKESAQFNRESGKMFDFFDRAGDVLAQWGDIIGNIVEGIGNIGSAAAPAGQALTDRFEEATRYFVEWTDENRERLEQYFNDIVPVFVEIGGLLVDVFKGLAKLADDPVVLQFVKLLRDEVGPAVSRLITAFEKAGTLDTFVNFVVELIDTLALLAESGGLQSFFDTVVSFFDTLQRLGESEGGREFIRLATQIFGAVSAWGLLLAPILLFGINIGRIFSLISALGTGLWNVLFGERFGVLTKITAFFKNPPDFSKLRLPSWFGGGGGKPPVPPRVPSPQPMLPGGAAPVGGLGVGLGIGALATGVTIGSQALGQFIEDEIERRFPESPTAETAGDVASSAARSIPFLGVTAPFEFIGNEIEEAGGVGAWWDDVRTSWNTEYDRLVGWFQGLDFNVGDWWEDNVAGPARGFIDDLPDIDIGQWWDDTIITPLDEFDLGAWWEDNNPFDDITIDIPGWVEDNIREPWRKFWEGDPIATAGIRVGDLLADIYLGVTGIPEWIDDNITTPWNNYWEVEWPGLTGRAKAAWDEFWNVTIGLNVSQWATNTLASIEDGWNNFWEVTWPGLTGRAKAAWDEFWNVTIGLNVSQWATNTLASIEAGWNNFWEVTWPGITGRARAAWDEFWFALVNLPGTVTEWFENLPQTIENWLAAIPGQIDRATAAIGQAWSKLWRGVADAALDPINWLTQSAWNNGIAKFWNNIAGQFASRSGIDVPTLATIPRIPPFSGGPRTSVGGGRVTALAAGGVIPGYAPGQDSVPALLSPGEGVLVPEAVRGLGGSPAIQAINAWFSSRVQRFASGGVANAYALPGLSARRRLEQQTFLGGMQQGLNSILTSASQAVTSGIARLSGLASGVVSSILDQGRSIIDGVMAGIRTQARSIVDTIAGYATDSPIGRLVQGVASSAIDLVVSRIPGLASGGTVLPSYGGTMVRLAESGRAETVVDTGVMNELIAELTRMLQEQGGAKVLLADGAITQNIYNPVAETPTASLARRQRDIVTFGLAPAVRQ